MELQLQQLQHVCGAPTALAVCAGGADPVAAGSREEGAAVLLAVAAEAARSPEKQRGAGAGATGEAVCGGSRGVRALRQHQRLLEATVAKQQAALCALERDNLRLLRYRKQFEAAAAALDGVAAAKAAAEAYATEAGLRAAAASGRADRLEMQLDEALRRASELQSERDALALQLHEARGLLQLHVHAVGGAPPDVDAAAPPLPPPAGGVAPVDAAAAAAPVGPRDSQQQATAGTGAPVLQQQCQQQPAAAAPQTTGAPDRDALAVVEELSSSLGPGASPVQGQLAALMAAIQAGMRERQQLAAQGQLLLQMVVAPAACRPGP